MNPFPDHQHLLYPIEIGIGPTHRPRRADGGANVERRYTVRAFTTCSEYLFVHPSFPNHDVHDSVIQAGRVTDWTITHAPTAAMVMTGIPDERTAMYLAGAVSQLWAWGHPIGAKSPIGRVTDFQRVFNRLPVILRDWIKSWGYKREA